GVLGVDSEDVLVRLFGLGHVAELVLERAREAAADALLNLWIRVRAEHVCISVGERLPPALDAGRKPRRLLVRLLVERELLQRADVRLERLRGVEELFFGELCE